MAARKLLRSISSMSIRSPSPSPSCLSSSSSLTCLRPIYALSSLSPGSPVRRFSSDEAPSSPPASPRYRPPKEPLFLPGCDYEHWLVVVHKPPPPPRENIIQEYNQILATVVGSEEVARKKIYSVSTVHYFAFGALISEELAYKLRDVDNVRFVLPDSYLDAQNQDYGGEPFIEGEAVPYDPKYYDVWLRREKKKKGEQQNQPLPQQRGPQHVASPLGRVGHGRGPNQQHVGSPQGAHFVHGQGPTPNLNNQHRGQTQYHNQQQQHSWSADQFGPGWNQFDQVGQGRGPNQQRMGSPQGTQFVPGRGPTPNLNNQHSGENQYHNQQQQHSSSSDQFGSGSNQFMNNKNSWNED